MNQDGFAILKLSDVSKEDILDAIDKFKKIQLLKKNIGNIPKNI